MDLKPHLFKRQQQIGFILFSQDPPQLHFVFVLFNPGSKNFANQLIPSSLNGLPARLGSPPQPSSENLLNLECRVHFDLFLSQPPNVVPKLLHVFVFSCIFVELPAVVEDVDNVGYPVEGRDCRPIDDEC